MEPNTKESERLSITLLCPVCEVKVHGWIILFYVDLSFLDYKWLFDGMRLFGKGRTV